jgi:hypothetical protein
VTKQKKQKKKAPLPTKDWDFTQPVAPQNKQKLMNDPYLIDYQSMRNKRL